MSSEEHAADLETEQISQSWMNPPKCLMSVSQMQAKNADLII